MWPTLQYTVQYRFRFGNKDGSSVVPHGPRYYSSDVETKMAAVQCHMAHAISSDMETKMAALSPCGPHYTVQYRFRFVNKDDSRVVPRGPRY
jgi:hypothetical protein